MIAPTFTCPHCEKESTPRIDTTGEMPVGLMVACDCPGARSAWETSHRADMERRKNALRGGTLRSKSIVHVGRTPTSTKKHRSR